MTPLASPRRGVREGAEKKKLTLRVLKTLEAHDLDGNVIDKCQWYEYVSDDYFDETAKEQEGRE